MAANLSSGNYQNYDNLEGIRIMEGCKPDVVMVQEFNYKTNSAADFQEMANLAITGSTAPANPAYYCHESGAGIPNGILSRYPILESGEWDDTYMTDRDFAWARIDIPGSVDLWAVSVHIKAGNASATSTKVADRERRTIEASSLRDYIIAKIPASDYLALGGDFNTYANDATSEPCLGIFDDFLVLSGIWPADASGNVNTNSGRNSPYDRVLADPDLESLKTATVIGAASFPGGLVVDTRSYQPLSDLAPALSTDSAAPSMQHMAVVRDFLVPVR